MTVRSPSTRVVAGLAGVVSLDLATKLAAASIAGGHRDGLLVPVRNHEFSLGIAGAPPITTILIVFVGMTIAAACTIPRARRGDFRAWIPACLIGGALANLLDRIASGSVHDFLATPWIVFNLADLAVVAGLAGLITARHRRSREEVDPLPAPARPH